MSLSKTSVIGRLTRDPEVKTVKARGEDQTVANFSVAVDRDFGEGTDFYDVVVWRKLADNVGRFLGKGRLVYVEGRMQKRTYTAKTPEGHEYPRDVWELNGDKVQFLDKAPENAQASGGYQQNQQPASTGYSGDAPF